MIKKIIKSNGDIIKKGAKNHTRILNEYNSYLNECEDLKRAYNLQNNDMVFCKDHTTFCFDEKGILKTKITFDKKYDNFASVYFRQGVIEYNKNLFYVKTNQIKINCDKSKGDIIYKTDILNLKSKRTTSICGEYCEEDGMNLEYKKGKKWWDIFGNSLDKFKHNEKLRYVDLVKNEITKNVNSLEEEIVIENM